MFDQFFDFYFTYINSLLYAGINVIGLFAGLQLLRRTRNSGPLFVFGASLLKLLVGISFPLSNYIENRTQADYDSMQRVWLSLSLLDLIGTTILLVGLTLIAKDFRSLLENQKLREEIATKPEPH